MRKNRLHNNQAPKAPVIEELEPRILLSAGVESALFGAAVAESEPTPQVTVAHTVADEISGDNVASAGRTLIFVDAATPDYQLLIDRLAASSGALEIIMLDSDRDGVEQISEALVRYAGLDAIHVISHGADGALELGNARLDGASLGAYRGMIGGWGDALAQDADILFYGCDVAAGDAGREFVTQLAELTGADIAASADTTGHASLGGDWTLEYAAGAIESGVVADVTTQKAWRGVLAFNGMAIWTDGGASGTQSSQYDGSVFEPEVAGASANLRIMRAAESPLTTEIIVVGVTPGRVVEAMIWDGSTWSTISLSPLATVSDDKYWGFDIQYEQQSGQAMLVWNNGTTGAASISYSLWDGTSWSAASTITTPLSGEARNLQLVGDVNSDEMILVVGNAASQDYALVWDGTAWNAGDVFSTAGGGGERGTAVMYETLSGQALATYSDDSNTVYYRTWNGSVWSAETAMTTPGTVGGNVRATTLAAHPNSDRLVLGVSTSDDSIWLAVWDGNAWEAGVDANDGMNASANGRDQPVVAVAFEGISGNALAMLSLNGTSDIHYRTWTAGSGWSADQIGPVLSNNLSSITAAADPYTNRVMLSVLDSASNLNLIEWNGAGWGTPVALESDAGDNRLQPFVYVWEKLPNGQWAISGNIFEDVDGDGGLGDAVAAAGVDVYLYRDDGDGVIDAGDALLRATTTDGGGAYIFTAISDDTYWVVVDSLTLTPTGGFNATFTLGDVWAEQSYASAGAVAFNGSYSYLGAAGLFHGGMRGEVSDDASALTSAEHVTRAVAAGADVTGVDSAFSFNVVSRTGDGDDDPGANRSIQGSLRQFIQNANAIVGVQSSRFYIPTTDSGYNVSGNGEFRIQVGAGGYDYVTDAIVLDGTNQAGYSANPIIELDGSAATGSSGGLVLRTDNSTIRGFIVHSFPDEGIEIDGSTGFGDNNTVQNNWVGINSSGADAGNLDYGVMVTVDAMSNQIGGTGLNDGNVIAGNVNAGVVLRLAGTVNNVVEGNYIGVGPDGLTPIANGRGIEIFSGASSNRIGGSTAAARNIISGNLDNGIVIWDAATTLNVISGNYIGTDVSGTLAVGNQFDGIHMGGGTSNNTIGGSAPGEGNLLSGNFDDGIEIAFAGTSGNSVLGNFIGTNAAGTGPLANLRHGVVIYFGANNTTVGGTAAGAGNVIAGNGENGIVIDGNGGVTTINNTVVGNFIGTNAAGNATVGNGENGIRVFGNALNNTIGGTAAGAGNVIGGNLGNGIEIESSDGVFVFGNFIGTDPGNSLDLGNIGSGVLLRGTTAGTAVGGVNAGEENVIAHNDGSGVRIAETAGTGNSILRNAIYANAQLGIDLLESGPTAGVTANDAGDSDTGANNLQNYPLLISANTDTTGSVYVAGTISAAASTTYRVEFFASATADASGYGQGENYLGFLDVTTDGSGKASFSTTLTGAFATGTFLSTTATAPDGSTSEFSANADALRMGVLVVDTTLDVVDGNVSSIAALLANRGLDNRISLREAILATNLTPNAGMPDEVRFNLQLDDPNHFYYQDDAGAGTLTLVTTTALADGDIVDFDPDYPAGTAASWYRFQPTSTLTIDDALIIDGFSQSGASANTQALGSDAIMKIVIDGDLSGNADGFIVNGDGSTLRGLVITGNFRAAIVINGDNVLVEGNYIGTDVTGTQASGLLDNGVEIVAGAVDALVGGPTNAARNVISGTTAEAIIISGTLTRANTVHGNYLGTNAQGTAALPFVGDAIALYDGTFDNVIRDNLISGNDTGILIDGGATPPTTNSITGNLIGTDATGGFALANGVGIVLRRGAMNTTIGGTTAAERNIIAYSGGAGVLLTGDAGTGNAILGNLMYANTGLGIDIEPAGVTGNDADDLDAGPNNLQNFPLLTSAISDGVGTITVAGSIDSAPSTLYRIELFASAVQDPSTYGEAEIYLGFVDVTTNASGDATFSVALSAVIPPGYFITATATDAANNTSEFAQNIVAVSIPPSIDLDNDDSSGQTGADFATTFVEDGGAVVIADADALIADPDSTIQSLTVTITNLLDGALESLSANTGVTGIVANYNALTGVLTLSGANSVANYQQVLRTVSYNNTSDLPTLTARAIEFVVNDGESDSNIATTTVTMTEVNDAPVNAVQPNQFTALDTDIVFASAGGNALQISDVDANGNDVEVTLAATQGTLTLASLTGLTITGGANGTATVTFTGSVTAINTALNAGLTFSPTTGYRGLAQLSITTDDQGNTGGAALSDTDVIDIHVGALVVTNATDVDTGDVSSIANLIANDGGDGISLREAIRATNNTLNVGGPDRIYFNIGGGGAWEIAWQSLLPTITEAVFIDGTSQPGYAGEPLIELDGTNGGVLSARLIFAAGSDGSTLQGVAITSNMDAIRLVSGNNTIQGNWIGLDRFGNAESNFGHGIDIRSSGNTIGGVLPGQGNVITASVFSGDGIYIGTAGAVGNRISGNIIYANQGLGIDLGPNGATPNDAGDADAGANDLQNTPVLTAAAVTSPTQVTISGNYNSLALSRTYRIEFFASAAGDASGYGEAERFLGYVDVTTDASGNVSFSTTLLAAVAIGEVITATATDLVTNSTSEFALNVTATNSAPVLDALQSPAMTSSEDNGAPSGIVGTLVSTLVDFANPAGEVDNVTDADDGALLGIAITAADSSNGSWWYSIDNGTTWLALGAVTDSNARLLAADGNTRLYFQANANYAGTSANALTFRAWDRSSGTNGALQDTSVNGGTTPFSTASDGVTLTVTNENDAPILTPAAPTLPTIDEDATGNSGVLISTLLGASVTDIDAGAVEGIAVNGLSSGNGTWQYSLDGGASWLDVGVVSDNSALLLRATDRIRFLPDAQDADSASFTFRAWDQATGTAGTKADATTNGGTTAFSTATDSASIVVTALNDAPVVAPASPTLPGITEDDINSGGVLVSTLLGASVSDVDPGAIEGIAITGLVSGNGTWQYSLDGGTTWLDVGAVADNSALLLTDSDLVRFVPDTLNADTASFTFRAWDQTSGTAGTKVDASTNGGTTAFSAATDSGSITVTAVNDAPVLTPASPTLPGITEDDTNNGGVLISTLLGASVSDVDTGAVEGIAITGLTSGNGTWQYSLDGGTTWLDVGAVADNSALLLADNDLVRFVPDALNADTASFTFRAWDQTSGTAGTKVDASTNGNTTAFSTAADSASITVTAVNDAPVLTPAAPTLPGITEDDTTNGGILISTLLGASVSDVDTGAVEGIAITGLTSGNGTWQYSLDGGTTWLDVGAVADNSALLLTDSDLVRFVPDTLNADTASFTFRAWDQTSGTAGTKVDASTNGNTTAFSAATDSGSITVTAVNDAPVLTPASPTLPGITEDDTNNGGVLISTLLGASVSDVDSGAVEGVAITGLTSGNGTWQYSLDGGTTWLDVGAVSDNSALLLTDSDLVRFVPDTLNADTASFTFRAWDQTSGTAGTKVDASTNGTTTAFSAATDSGSITVTAVNDAPVLTAASPTLPGITEDDTNNGGVLISTLLGASVSDVDSGAVEGIAITGLTSGNGTWQYSLDGGATWLNVGVVSDSAALLLAETDLVRFVPDGQNADAASFTFRAWDQTSGTAGTKVDASTNGGTTAFSTATDSASIAVTAVNDAPVLTPASPTLPGITEDDTTNGGILISTLLGASVSDVDTGALEGIAITGLTSGNGTWQYSLDGGTTWLDVGAVSDNSALLLTDSDLVRFVPDTLNDDTASFTFRAWDQTSGTAGAKVDASTNGNTTAFSAATDSGSITVTAVNDAPVLTPASPTLPGITEDDTNNGGVLISTLLGASVSDVDTGAVEGIAITGLTSGNGTWQYSLDGGATWLNVGVVSDSAALLLAETDLVRFVPDGQNADAASFTFRAWDQTSGTAGTKVDAGTNGGTTAFSTATDSASITVTAVNDAPVLTPASPTLPGITEDDTNNGGVLVSTLLGASVSDVDTGAVEGIAITGLSSGNGTWQYSLDGGTTWLDVGAVADNSALLLTDSDLVRFVPDTLNADAASFTFSAWDQTSGTAGTKVDASTNGGTTAFSAATDSGSITVTAVNDAPVLTPASPTLPGITEDDASNGGVLVSTLLGASVSDVDTGAVEGIAITGLTSGNGTWQYSLDGGTTWLDVGAVADNSALLLADNDLVRFVPDALNADTASFTFRAWDQTSGTAGTKVDASTNGNTTAFSTAADSASITVTAVNDAPVLAPASPSLPGITEDDTNNGGVLVATLLGASVSDVDTGAVEGIAITGLTSGNGTWQYSLDGGTTWLDVGAVADNSALLLTDSDLVRFVPDTLNADTASFTFRAWDQTSGAAGTKVDASTNGATTAFSTATDSASITVTAVNDAPVLTPASPTLPGITEDDTNNGGVLVSTLLGASVSDVDTGAVEGIAITGLTSGNGTWQYSLDGGTTWLDVGAVADNSALLLADSDLVRFVPDTLNADTASFTFRAWDQSSGTAGTKVDASTNGATTAFSTATDSASITVTAVNDAPVLTPASPTLPGITEDDTNNGGVLVSTLLGASVSDVDTGAVEGIAITGLVSGNGTWQYSLDGGTTWLDVGAVADNAALLLTDNDLVRFVPDTLNADAASFTFRAWDQTSGTAGTKVDASTNGTSTAFSTATDSASITVTAVNDAPVLTPAAPTLPGITEDDTNNGGVLISTLLGASVSDVDTGAVEGIAVTGLVSGNGTWQYSLDGGTTWLDVGVVSDASALLLTDSDLVRFVPDTLNDDTASFTFRAWDQTSGTAGTKVDVSTNGATTAFSAATDSGSITVTAVNDAPVLTPASPTLPGITEDDASNGGVLVSTLLGASVSDVDTGALEGIAITGLTSGNGTWQYSLDGGTTWLDVGVVADNSALLLTDSDLVRFVPDGQNADAASFTFRAWDQASGTAGTKVDASTNGDTTAFSTATDSASITVTAVNDAPVLTPASPTLPGITEDDTNNGGVLISTLLGASVSDVDTGAVEGIAITGLTSGNGTWQYSLDGGTTWLDVGAVADNSALLLTDSDLVRFVPDGQNTDAASFTFRAWDQASGTAGTKVDASTNGGTTAFSTATDSAAITVTAVNDAPVLTAASPTLPGITEDDTNNGGVLVSTLLGASVSDVDTGAVEGIAVTGLTSGNGTWQYSLDGGTTWLDVGAVSDNSALLLTDSDLVRFVPDTLNADTASFTFRAWDQTSGTAGTKVDASTNGTSTAFSTATDSASITVTAVNDAPVLTPAAPTLPGITEDDTNNGGVLISTLLGASVSDVDTGAVEGIAVTGLVSGNGTWQYSLDGGTTWLDVGVVSDASALLLTDSDLVRFVPDTLNDDTASFTFRAWDQTSGTAGTKVDVSTNGATTAFSAATDSGSITVTAVNDAPVLTPASPTLPGITEDDTNNGGVLVSTLLGASVSDVDTGAVEGIAITGLTSGNGTWQYSLDGGTTWLDVGAVADNAALLLTDSDLVRFVPDALNADTASFTFRAWDQTSGAAGTKVDASTNGAATAFSTATDSASITVTAVNDAPVLAPASPSLPGITEDDTNNGGVLVATLLGASVSDVDSGAVEGIAITGLTSGNGTWQYSLDGGTTWLNVGAVADNSALLLTDSDLVRFVPDTLNADTASFTFRAWDQTSGTAGTKVDASTTGATTAFSTATDSASITVTAVNDAPVLTPASPTLPGITEDDTTNGGVLVSTLLGASVTDVDTGDVEGIAITALISGNGTWQYSLDGGATWLDVGIVSNASALLLTDTDLVRFVPDTLNADTASFTFRAWDQTSGSAGAKVDVSTNGGTSAFSTATDNASIAVTAVNDAPVLTPASPTLPGITEDNTNSAGILISTLLGTSVSDVDSGAVEGIAITALTSGNGTWQYSLDGGTTWLDVGVVSDASALLLTGADLVRFVPDTLNADTASFTFRAWDQTSGSVGTKVDASANGASTAFSAATDSGLITVTAVNDAPVLTPASPTLPGITEDDTNNGGVLVSTLLGVSVSDVDSGAVEGIAINSLTSSNGTWQYSLDGGTTWLDVGVVSDSSALLLAATDLVRFVPDALDADAASFTFRAWDQTSGSAGARVDVSTNGATTAFSSASDTASITVAAANDLPTTVGISDQFTTEDSAPVTVDLRSYFTDVEDGAALLTFNVVGNTNPSLLGAVSIDAATGLLTLDLAADAFGTTTITIRATDTEGGMVETSFVLDVASVNDAPVAIAAGTVAAQEDAPRLAFNVATLFSDVDHPLSSMTFVVVGNDNLALASTTLDPLTGLLHIDLGADMNGTATLTVRATDPLGGQADASVALTVDAVDDASVTSVTQDPQTVAENQYLLFSSAMGNQISIDDIDSGVVSVTLQVPAGGLSLGTTDGLTFSAGDGVGDNLMTFTGTLAAVNQALDGLSYAPLTGFGGVMALSITLSDATLPAALRAPATQSVVQILVLESATAPVASAPLETTAPVIKLSNSTVANLVATDASATADDEADEEPAATARAPAFATGFVLPMTPVVSFAALANERPEVGNSEIGGQDLVSTVARVLRQLAVDTGLPSFVINDAVWNALAALQDDLSNLDDPATRNQTMAVTLATGITLTLSAGFVTWLMRAGSLLTSLLSTTPMWQRFDPLPILAGRRDDDDDEQDRDAVAAIFGDKQ